MPRVVLSDNICRLLAGGAAELEVAATSFRRLITELEARFPGLGRQVEQRMALAIDGVIYQDSTGAELTEGSEIVLIPKIGGG